MVQSRFWLILKMVKRRLEIKKKRQLKNKYNILQHHKQNILNQYIQQIRRHQHLLQSNQIKSHSFDCSNSILICPVSNKVAQVKWYLNRYRRRRRQFSKLFRCLIVWNNQRKKMHFSMTLRKRSTIKTLVEI